MMWVERRALIPSLSLTLALLLSLCLLARSPREKEVVGGVIRFGADNNTLKSPSPDY